ncbi:MAG: serine/threonine-protein kinase [Myxococcales bacterium]|nr:serine/threonine-protein kinase [Myxococcales bacterium]
MSAGIRFGDYVLYERIATGGMAEVYRAGRPGTAGFERPVAIKKILPHLSADPEFVRMFVDEAKIAVRLDHPAVVRILDLGRVGEDYFIAMELVEGRDMRAIVTRLERLGRRMPVAAAVHVALRCCEALEAAHGATGIDGRPLGIVHRDVSPANVLVSFDGEVKVADFGLARASGRATQTTAGVVKGKLAYMSPEQASGRPVDHRTDLFSLGLCLWEWLAGRRAYRGRTDVEIAIAAQRAHLPPLRELDSSIPVPLERVIQRALCRDPAARWPTAARMREALEEAAVTTGTLWNRARLAAFVRDLFPEAFPVGEPTTGHRAPDPTDRSPLPRHDTIPAMHLEPQTTQSPMPEFRVAEPATLVDESTVETTTWPRGR